MGVKINIPSSLQHLANGQAVAGVSGNTVGQCRDNLVKQFPGIESEVFEKNGKLLEYVDIYINLESSYPEELAKPVKDGDELHITFFTIAGG